jgi:hypothetical protein
MSEPKACDLGCGYQFWEGLTRCEHGKTLSEWRAALTDEQRESTRTDARLSALIRLPQETT